VLTTVSSVVLDCETDPPHPVIAGELV
jgi:hypothetical protein